MNRLDAPCTGMLPGFVTCLILLVAGCAKGPDSPEVMLERARMLMDRGRGAEAIPLLDRVVTALPQNPEAYYQRGVAYENLELPEKALADYTACLKLDDLRTDALNNKAVQLAKLRRYDEAITAFSELVELDPMDFLGYRNRGLCRFDMHDDAGALQDYNTALQLNPDDSSSWFQRGKVYLSMNDLNDAENDFSKAIALDAGFAKAWMNRGVVRYRKGEGSLAAEDLTTAQKLDSNIAVPAIDFFHDAASAAAATEAEATSVWNRCRSFTEGELAERGYSGLEFVREFPEFQCAEVRGEFDGQPRTILVTCHERGLSTFTVPCPERPQSRGGEQLPVALLVLQVKDDNAAAPEVLRFERQWDPVSQPGRPVIMNYEL